MWEIFYLLAAKFSRTKHFHLEKSLKIQRRVEMRLCQKSPFLCCELGRTSLSFLFEIFCHNKFPRPVSGLFRFPVSKSTRLIYTVERLAMPPPVLVPRFEQSQHGCRNAVLHAVIYGILYSLLRCPSCGIKKKGEENHPVTLSLLPRVVSWELGCDIDNLDGWQISGGSCRCLFFWVMLGPKSEMKKESMYIYLPVE